MCKILTYWTLKKIIAQNRNAIIKMQIKLLQKWWKTLTLNAFQLCKQQKSCFLGVKVKIYLRKCIFLPIKAWTFSFNSLISEVCSSIFFSIFPILSSYSLTWNINSLKFGQMWLDLTHTLMQNGEKNMHKNIWFTAVARLQTALKVAGHKNSVSLHQSPPFCIHSET